MPSHVQIHHLYTSPGHNYFGHHGQQPGGHGIVEHTRIELHAGRGICGDRFYAWKDDYKGQVTFIDLAVVDAVRQHAGRPDIAASSFRRNIVISGMDLNAWIGQEFELGGVRFIGTQECSPCHWMDRACGTEGTEAVMKGRGGLRCRVLSDGFLRTGEHELIAIEAGAIAGQ
jgi:MOSC domain